MPDQAPLLTDAELAQAMAPLDQASTLPARTYTDPRIYEMEVDRLFRRQWLCAGRVDQVPSAGDYRTIDLLDDALVLVRGKDDAVRVLSRVCRHRSADLIPGGDEPRCGNTANFSCPYHAWSYRLDGRLLAAPLMHEAKDFQKAECGLPEVRSEIWNGFVFVNLSGDAPPLGPQLAGLQARICEYGLGDMVSREVAVFDSPWHWRVLVENFMEAYHHIATHLDTLQPILPAKKSWVPDNDGPWSLLVMPAEDPGLLQATASTPPIEGLADWQKEALLAAVVFPFHLFALSPESMTWYQLFPLSHGRFTLRIFSCLPRAIAEDPQHAEARMGHAELLKVIHGQDIQACDAVSAGLRSSSARPGRLSNLEKSIWELNAWWLAKMKTNHPPGG